MVNYNLISRLACWMGAGKPTLTYARNNRQRTWVWETAARASVLEILQRVEPHLQSKLGQARLMLDYLQAPSLTETQQHRIYMALCELKERQPGISRNQHGACILHRDRLRQRYPRLFQRTEKV